MGSNCPAAVQSLLNGCISVYHTAYDALMSSIRALMNGTQSPKEHETGPLWKLSDSDRRRHRQYVRVINICIESVRLLSQLSPREAQRTMYLLRRPNFYSLSSSWSKTTSRSSGGMVPLQLELAMQHDPLWACFLLVEHLRQPPRIFFPWDASGDNNNNRKAVSYSELLTLQEYFVDNPEFFSNVWNFLFKELLSSPLPIPRLSITLETYVTFITEVPMVQLLQLSSSSAPQNVILSCRAKLLEKFIDLQQACRGDTTNIHKSTSHVYDLLIVSLISTDVILMTHGKDRADAKVDLRILLDQSAAPTQSRQLVLRLSLALQYGDSQALYDIIKMTRGQGRIASQQVDTHFLPQLNDYCQRILLDDTSLNKVRFDEGINNSNTFYLGLNPSLAMQLIKSTVVPIYVKIKVGTHLLKLVLGDELCAKSYIQDPQIVEFIVESTSIILMNHESKVPLIMPIQIEMMAMKIQNVHDNFGTDEVQFLLQLLYCFTFLQHEPKSPFQINPRMLPLHLVFKLCEVSTAASLQIHKSVANKLKSHIDKCCPGTRTGYKYRVLKSRVRLHSSLDSSFLESMTKMEFSESMRRLVIKPNADLCGLLTEQAFIEASFYLSESDLISACAIAFLSQPSSPSIYFTYPMLYRDPLIMLKCPLSIWKRRGTRRIAITILCRLLETHEHELNNQAPNDNVFAELLSSRNAIVLSCLIRIAASSSTINNGVHLQCGMTCGLIRKLVATNPGLLALLLKQRWSDSEIDWMIESIPEVIVDMRKLRGLLGDRSALTAAERLTVADYSLRIAIVHGNSNDDIAVSVALACLSQLLSSFFLILGPIGVPVNALIADGDELDTTQASRRAAFRLLNALQMIQPFQTRLTKDASVMLQKFVSMCKSESISSGLPSSIATRQKNLLSRLINSAGTVLDSMNATSKRK